MLNRIFKISTLFAFALVFVMTSCQKENLEELTTENFTQQREERSQDFQRGKGGDKGNRGGSRNNCFTTVYPVTINFPDGSAATVADRAEAKAAKEAYNEANPDNEESATLAFPYDVELRDSTIVTITNEEELAALAETCSDDRGGNKGNRGGSRNNCFTTVYPVTINFPDGSAVTVADRNEAKAIKEAYNEANPDNEERATLAFPYDVELADGTTVTVESDEEVDALKESCTEEEDEERSGRGNRGGNRNGGQRGGN